VARRGLTVRQTERFVTHLLEQADATARQRVLDAWHSGLKGPVKPSPRPSRALRSEADWMATDVTTLHRVAARLQARLLGTPLRYDRAVAARLAQHVFQTGNTVDPVQAYRAFRGKDPGTAALMRKRGFPVAAPAQP
jgi:hypothetical protein